MKKTYLAPVILVVNTMTTTVIATSLNIDTSKSGDEALVKEEEDFTGTRPHYDVWEEDWNEGEE